MTSPDQAAPGQSTMGRRAIFWSPVSFFSLLGTFAAGFLIAWAYKQGATDEFKYGCIIATIICSVLCCVAISRSLTHAGLTISQLRSVRTTLIIGLIEGLLGAVYAYVLYFASAVEPSVRDALLQPPVIYAICTCILMSYVYLFYVNLAQTGLFFLALTLTVLEILASLAVFVALLLSILSKNVKTGPVVGGGPSPSHRLAQQYRDWERIDRHLGIRR